MYLKLSGKIMKTYSKTHTLNENYRLANEISEWGEIDGLRHRYCCSIYWLSASFEIGLTIRISYIRNNIQ